MCPIISLLVSYIAYSGREAQVIALIYIDDSQDSSCIATMGLTVPQKPTLSSNLAKTCLSITYCSFAQSFRHLVQDVTRIRHAFYNIMDERSFAIIQFEMIIL